MLNSCRNWASSFAQGSPRRAVDPGRSRGENGSFTHPVPATSDPMESTRHDARPQTWQRSTRLILALSVGLALAGCANSKPEPQVAENASTAAADAKPAAAPQP